MLACRFQAVAKWHIYGFLASPTKCAFYVDGKVKKEFPTPKSYLNCPMYITLEYNNGGGWPLTGLVANSHLDVDWVRVGAAGEITSQGNKTAPMNRIPALLMNRRTIK